MQAAQDGGIYLQSQHRIAAQVVEQCALRRCLQLCGVGCEAARCGGVPGKLGNLFQVLGIADYRLAPLRYQRIQQLAHLVVVGRVHRRLVDDELAHVVFNRLGHRLVGFHHTLELGLRRIRPALHDQLNQVQLVKGGNLLALFGADVGVYQVAHGRLVGLEVNVVAAGQAHLVAQLAGLVHLSLNLADLRWRIARFHQLACNGRIGTHQRRHKLVEFEPLGFVLFELCCVTRFDRAKVMQKRRRRLRPGHRLTQRLDRFARVFQVLAGLVQAVFQQALDIFGVIAVQRAAGVVAHCPFQAFEQVLVVDDVAVFLVIAIQPIDAANGLEQAVVTHLLVDVEVGGRGRIKAGEQLVHHDQELHLARFVNELLFHLLFNALGLGDGPVRALVEPFGQHLPIHRVLQELVGHTLARGLALGVGHARCVTGDDGAFAF